MLQTRGFAPDFKDEMYSALFRLLPGNFVFKILQVVVMLMVAVAFLFLFVFPFVETLIQEDPSVNG